MIYARPGQTREWTLYGVPTGHADDAEFSIEDGQGTVVLAATSDGIVESPDGSGVYTVTFDAPDGDVGSSYVLLLAIDDESASETLELTPAGLPAPSPPEGAFASAEEVGWRLGRDLTDAEVTRVEIVLGRVGGLIRAEAGKSADWNPSPVPAALAEMSIQKAVATLVNPSNVAATSKSLGAFSESLTFQRSQDGGVFLSDEEGRQVRFAIYGTNSGSARMRSHVDTALDLIDDGEINDSLGS